MSLVGTTTPLCCVCFETLGAKGGPATLPCGESKRERKKKEHWKGWHLKRESKALARPKERSRQRLTSFPSLFCFNLNLPSNRTQRKQESETTMRKKEREKRLQ